MNFKVFEAKHNSLAFKIEEDYSEVGAYLYVYEDGRCIRDYLQNDIDHCKEFAYKKYEVPIDKWVRKDDITL